MLTDKKAQLHHHYTALTDFVCDLTSLHPGQNNRSTGDNSNECTVAACLCIPHMSRWAGAGLLINLNICTVVEGVQAVIRLSIVVSQDQQTHGTHHATISRQPRHSAGIGFEHFSHDLVHRL